MTYQPFEICNCNCHTMEGIYHVMACCHQCPHCGANIKHGYEDEHGQRCEQERLDAGLPVNQHHILNDLSDRFSAKKYLNWNENDIIRHPKTIYEQVMDDIDQEVIKEMWDCIMKAELEETPAVKFLRECQERERKLGK